MFGGSQGAAVFAEVVPLALEVMEKGLAVEVLYQSRREEVENLQRLYEKLGISARVTPFIDEMGLPIRRRSG